MAGEARAAAWYEARGGQILDRNWRCRDGELDLIVREGGTIVFCEVKSRTGDRFGLPAEAVTPNKQARIRRLAARWLREHSDSLGARRSALRFDVATVLGDRLEVLEAAF
jgi:putative endonuclease